MATAYAVVSGKGGVGKSTLAANVAAALARMGKAVCLVDVDIGLRSQDVFFGLENQIVYDIVDVLEEVCELKQALLRAPCGVALLPAAQMRDVSAVSCAGMEALVGQIKQQFDFVLIDAPAGIGRGYRNAVCAADAAILVTVPETVSLRDAERVKGLLEREGVAKPSFALNRATWRNGAKGRARFLRALRRGAATAALRRGAGGSARGRAGGRGQAGHQRRNAGRGGLPAHRAPPRGESVPVEYPRKPGFFQRLFFRE